MTVAIDAFKQHMHKMQMRPVEQRAHLKSVVEVGRKAQMVVDHPGWQTYVDHLTAIKDSVQARRNKLATDMSETDALGEALAQMKLQLRALDGELKGLSAAVDLIPTMIQRASDAVKLMERAEVKSPDAGE
jgi:hypothetical protein